MENIFQNSPRGANRLFDNDYLKEKGKTLQGGSENLFIQKKTEPNIVFEESFLKEKKRINDVDNALLFRGHEDYKKSETKVDVSAENIFEKSYKRDYFLKKYFPKLYGRKILKAINKKIELIEEKTKKENVKQIPYGEREMRYENLAQNLSKINYLQSKLNKEIK